MKSNPEKHYIYIIRSTSKPSKYYIGLCSNFENRLKEHNAGECKTTAELRPWKTETVTYFQDVKKAHTFEPYLKSGSGRAFSKRHF